jgi:hypothetical protein
LSKTEQVTRFLRSSLTDNRTEKVRPQPSRWPRLEQKTRRPAKHQFGGPLSVAAQQAVSD